MDKDFNNYVRFKDFCKFVKKHKKGKAYENVATKKQRGRVEVVWVKTDGNDSSFSSSDVFEDEIKGFWKEIDPERNCVVSVEAVYKFCAKEGGIAEDDVKPIIKKELDALGLLNADGDGTVTFKEFNKFFKQRRIHASMAEEEAKREL